MTQFVLAVYSAVYSFSSCAMQRVVAACVALAATADVGHGLEQQLTCDSGPAVVHTALEQCCVPL